MKKNSLFICLLFFYGYINAQQLMPRAGEFLTSPVDHMIKPAAPLNNETLTVINFDSLEVSFKGNFPFADSYAIELDETDSLLFIGSGGGIFITDISNPSEPVIISEVRTRSLVDRCTYDPINKRLYVCAYFSGIEIWDLSDIYSPERMSRIPTEPYPRSGVWYKNNYIIFATNNSVWSVDITDPYNPVFANELFISSSLILQSDLQGDVLFLVDIQGLRTVDVSDPLNLQLITSTAYISGSRFDISGSYLYAVKSGSLTILNISDPAAVTYSGSLSIDGYPEDVKYLNNKVYIAKMGTDGGLQIVDVENPAAPVHISFTPGNYRLLTGFNVYIYITMSSQFNVLDITDPLAVQNIGEIQLPGFTQDAAASGNYLYTGSNGFRVIDISDHANPQEVGYADIDGLLVEPADDSIVIFCPYSMTANNTIHVMDVSDPTTPVSVDNLTSPAMTWDLEIKDNMAVIACWWDGIRLFSFEDPNDFKLLSRVMGWQQGGIPGTEWCYAQAAAVEGNYVYVVDWGPFTNEDTYGLYIIDISNPLSPFLVKRFKDITSQPRDIEVVNGTAYIADGAGGLEIVNVSDPNNPVVLSYIPLPDGATAVTVEDDFAYTSNYILGGVQVIDIMDPSNPTIAGWYKPSGCFALNVNVQNGDIFISDGIAGIQIYRNQLVPVSSVKDNNITLTDFNLVNYPNPFNPSTNIEYTIPADDHVSLIIFNPLGEETAVLVNEYKKAGTHNITFNASGLSSGIYFYKIKSGSRMLTGKMALIR